MIFGNSKRNRRDAAGFSPHSPRPAPSSGNGLAGDADDGDLAKELRALGYEIYTGRAVCKEGARLGLPDAQVLAAHAEQALAQGAPEDELTADVRAGYTGVIAILRCGEGPTVAMRFDIDALPMTECPQDAHRPTREGFASVNPGMMHACGHDGHAAIGLGVARILMAHRDVLHGTVKLIFQ